MHVCVCVCVCVCVFYMYKIYYMNKIYVCMCVCVCVLREQLPDPELSVVDELIKRIVAAEEAILVCSSRPLPLRIDLCKCEKGGGK